MSLDYINSKIEQLETKLEMYYTSGEEPCEKVMAQLEMLQEMADEIYNTSEEYEAHRMWLDEQTDYAYNDVVTMSDLA